MTTQVASLPSPPRQAVVSLDVLRRNARLLYESAPASHRVIDLRGDAYGHGVIGVGHALDEEPFDAYLVSDQAVAEELLRAGVKTPALVRTQLPVEGSVVIGPELFGLDSPGRSDPRPSGLLPVLTLAARVLAVKKVGADEGVSYGYVYRTPRATTLAMVCLGYSDGIDRHACEGGRAWFAGSTHPIAGRVAMDVFMLDVGDTSVSPGDEAVLFGDESRGYPSPVSWAAALGKTGAQVTSSLGDRIVRSYR
jgi:alanine racemase